MFHLFLVTDVVDNLAQGLPVVMQHGIACRLDHGIGQVCGMMNLACNEIALDESIQKHTAGDDKTGDRTGNRDDSATVNAAEHDSSPWFDRAAAGSHATPQLSQIQFNRSCDTWHLQE